MSRGTFIELAGGRRAPTSGAVADRGRHRPRAAHRRRPRGDAVSRELARRRHARPDRAHRRRHRLHRRRARLPHRPRAGPARRPGGARRPLATTSSTRPSAAITDEVPDAELGRLVVDLADLSSVRRAAAHAGTVGPIHCLVNNAGVMATPESRTAGRLRAAAGDQPLRPVPADRAAAAPAGRQRRRPGRGGVVADAPGREAAAAGRPAQADRPLPALADLRPLQAGQPALHLRARPAAAARPSCR